MIATLRFNKHVCISGPYIYLLSRILKTGSRTQAEGLSTIFCECWDGASIWSFEVSRYYRILPLDEPTASGSVIVIVSGPDERADWRTDRLTDGRKRFCSQLKDSKPVRKIDFMCQWEAHGGVIGTFERAIEWAYSDHTSTSNSPNRGSKGLPSKLQPNSRRSENVNRAQLRMHSLAVKWSDAMDNRTPFSKGLNEWTQIEHNMHGRRAFWLPLWWWHCLHGWPGSAEVRSHSRLLWRRAGPRFSSSSAQITTRRPRMLDSNCDIDSVWINKIIKINLN